MGIDQIGDDVEEKNVAEYCWISVLVVGLKSDPYVLVLLGTVVPYVFGSDAVVLGVSVPCFLAGSWVF